jgi:uncharacterized protein (TIGR01244 family)
LIVPLLVLSMLPVVVAAQEPADGSSVDVDLDLEGLPREVKDFEGEIRGLWRDGRVFVGGQPDQPVFGRLAERGVTAVVNLRTPAEMTDRDRVPFDEAAIVGDLGMEYVHIPLGGDDHPYTPEAVDRFAAVLERHDGPVLLHCTVAWRASHMWTAYLVREQGLDLADAVTRGEAIAFGTPPVEGLLGRPLELIFAD